MPGKKKLLMSAKGQDQLAQAIFKAVAEYKFAMKRGILQP
jgi:N-acetylmuramoyl-L-alanine amidase